MNAEELTTMGRLIQSVEDLRSDVRDLRGVQEETLSEVRLANGKAADALRLATANAKDIEKLQEWQRWVRRVLEPFGGLEGFVSGVKKLLTDVGALTKQHENNDIRTDERRRIRQAMVKGVVAGAAVAGSVMSAIGIVAGWIF